MRYCGLLLYLPSCTYLKLSCPTLREHFNVEYTLDIETKHGLGTAE